MATQKEVAKLAGVSFITVSRVVNNEPNVKESTRIKVEEAIHTLGYVPSFAGKALNSGRCETIGVMTPARFGDGMENNYLMGVLRGIELVCREQNQDILLSPLAETDPDFDYLRPYRQRKVDGMIYVGLKSMPTDMVNEMEERLIPCVVIGDRPTQKNISWIDTDNESAGYETTKLIWNKGHRVIAFQGLIPELLNENISDREKGYRKAIKEVSGVNVNESLIWKSGYDTKAIRRNIREEFEKANPKPTAIFCSTDNRALATLRELNEMGVTVPNDVSLVGFDGFLKDYLTHPSMATNEQPLVEMGKRAAEILLHEIKERTLERHEEVFPVTFIDGESLSSIYHESP